MGRYAAGKDKIRTSAVPEVVQLLLVVATAGFEHSYV